MVSSALSLVIFFATWKAETIYTTLKAKSSLANGKMSAFTGIAGKRTANFNYKSHKTSGLED